MAKVRISHDFSKVLNAIKDDYVTVLSVSLKKKIIDLISKGISPVKGKGRFVRYSERYRDAIKKGRHGGKRQRPVNLKLSGALHKSIKGRKTQKGLTIWFSDKKAEWHNKGMGSLPVRRLLPEGDEGLSRVIQKHVQDTLTSIVKNAFR